MDVVGVCFCGLGSKACGVEGNWVFLGGWAARFGGCALEFEGDEEAGGRLIGVVSGYDGYRSVLHWLVS